MYTASFFGTKLGKSALASIAAMIAMIAMTSQMNMVAADAHIAQPINATALSVELA